MHPWTPNCGFQAPSPPLGAPAAASPSPPALLALPAQLSGPPLSSLPHPVTHPHANLIGGEARAAHAHRLWIKDVDFQEVTWRPVSVGQVLWLRVEAPSISNGSVRHLSEGATGTREGGVGDTSRRQERARPLPLAKSPANPQTAAPRTRAHARRTHARARKSFGPRPSTLNSGLAGSWEYCTRETLFRLPGGICGRPGACIPGTRHPVSWEALPARSANRCSSAPEIVLDRACINQQLALPCTLGFYSDRPKPRDLNKSGFCAKIEAWLPEGAVPTIVLTT